MRISQSHPFILPDLSLSELPTGSVKTAVDALGRKIAHGDYEVGETIPKEADLCELLGVSRTVVREATKVLSGKGLLRTARRYGTRVLPYESWNLLDPDVIQWHDPNSPSASRIYVESTQLRLMVEPEAARLAAMNATPEQKAFILKAAEHIHPEPFGHEGMIAADYAFHATVLEGTGNMMLAQLRGLILSLLKFSYPTGAQAAPFEKVSRPNHILVAKAIQNGEPDLARERMRMMLMQNRVVAEAVSSAGGTEAKETELTQN